MMQIPADECVSVILFPPASFSSRVNSCGHVKHLHQFKIQVLNPDEFFPHSHKLHYCLYSMLCGGIYLGLDSIPGFNYPTATFDFFFIFFYYYYPYYMHKNKVICKFLMRVCVEKKKICMVLTTLQLSKFQLKWFLFRS